MSLIQKIRDFFDGIKYGTVEKIDLTWGGAGNQIMTIDGVRYATWIDYKEWPKHGDVVKHRPYKRFYRSDYMLCTDIESNLTKQNTQPTDVLQ